MKELVGTLSLTLVDKTHDADGRWRHPLGTRVQLVRLRTNRRQLIHVANEQIRILIQKRHTIDGLGELDRPDELLLYVPYLDKAFVAAREKELLSLEAVDESELFLVLVLIRRLEEYELVVELGVAEELNVAHLEADHDHRAHALDLLDGPIQVVVVYHVELVAFKIPRDYLVGSADGDEDAAFALHLAEVQDRILVHGEACVYSVQLVDFEEDDGASVQPKQQESMSQPLRPLHLLLLHLLNQFLFLGILVDLTVNLQRYGLAEDYRRYPLVQLSLVGIHDLPLVEDAFEHRFTVHVGRWTIRVFLTLDSVSR